MQCIGKISGIVQQEKRFQQAGFATVVVPGHQIDMIQVRNKQLLDAAKLLNLQTFNMDSHRHTF